MPRLLEADAAPHAMQADALAAQLATDVDRGLSSAEARRRLELHGPNELEAEEPVPAWRRLAEQFQDALVVLLLGATALSAGVWLVERDTPVPYEALAILAIVLLNAVLGYVQEARAERALEALRQTAAARALVVRDGTQRSVPTSELVPGDVAILEAGDTIPADARLVRVTSLQTNEASLTGESLPVVKRTAAVDADASVTERTDMAFAGTIVTYGRGRAVVTGTGADTEIGRVADLLGRGVDKESPFRRELDRVGRMLGLAVLAISAVIVTAILLIDGAQDVAALVEVLLFGVALAVAAVPEGLPAIVTAVLALGVQRMAKRNAIVRKLAAVETLGSATVIATDKTGTLTRNEMTVRTVVTASGRADVAGVGYAPEGEVTLAAHGPDRDAVSAEVERVLRAADRASNARIHREGATWRVQGDPTEGALNVAARKFGLADASLGERFERVDEVPFSSERQMMSTVHRDAAKPDRLVVFAKGAPDRMLEQCAHELVHHEAHPLTPERRERIHGAVDALAADGMRTLAVAFRSLPPDALADSEGPELEERLVLLGLVGMIDPPRAEAAGSVARAIRAGIRPVMITGDHPITALAVAEAVGLDPGGPAVRGAEVERMTDGELQRTVAVRSVFARVSPEHKLRIVEALQRNGQVVAVTGDGVNDAPALQAGDIGVAMGVTGTDVAKGAADMVLADDDFATIVAAVEQGRAIFANVRKFLRFLLSSNFGEVLTIFLGVVLAPVLGLTGAEDGFVLPLLATQILWINLLTDAGPALALGVDPSDPDVMRIPPRQIGEGAITPRMWAGIGFVGLVMAAATLTVMDASLPGGLVAGSGEIAYARTMAFTTLVLLQLFNALNARSDERSVFVGFFRNRWLWGALGLSVALQVVVVYLPALQPAFGTVGLTPGDWLVCAAAASSVLWLREGWKLVARMSASRRSRWI